MLKNLCVKLSYISLLFSVIALSSTLALAQQTTTATVTKQLTNSTPNDVLGWQDSRWGMSKSDIQKVFPNTTNTQSPKVVCGDPYADNSCVSKNFKLADESFTVLMTIDNTKGLKQITIVLDQIDSPKTRLMLFEKVEELLTQKYGTVKYQKDNNILDLMIRTRQWVFPSTIIELQYNYVGKHSISLLTITYKPASESDANKL